MSLAEREKQNILSTERIARMQITYTFLNAMTNDRIDEQVEYAKCHFPPQIGPSPDECRRVDGKCFSYSL